MEQVGQHLYDVLNKQDVDPKKEFITLLKVNQLLFDYVYFYTYMVLHFRLIYGVTSWICRSH